MTGCQGELSSEEFTVLITDDRGEEVINEVLKSGENGFIDLWLPRNKSYSITIQHGDKIVESELTTYQDSNTCITTMQLK